MVVKYNPTKESSGYAVLAALYFIETEEKLKYGENIDDYTTFEVDYKKYPERKGVTKEVLIEKANKFSKKPIDANPQKTAHNGDSYYGYNGWSGVTKTLIKKYNLVKKSQIGRIHLYRLTDGIDGGRIFSQNLVKKYKLVSSGTYLFSSNHIRSPSSIPSPQLHGYNSPSSSPIRLLSSSLSKKNTLLISSSSSSKKSKLDIQNDIPKKKYKSSFYADEKDNSHDNYLDEDHDISYIIQPRFDYTKSISHINNTNNNKICTISDSDECMSDIDKDKDNINSKLCDIFSHNNNNNNNNNNEICSISDSDEYISNDNRKYLFLDSSSKTVLKKSVNSCITHNNPYYDTADGNLIKLNSRNIKNSKDLDKNRSIIQNKDISSPFIIYDDNDDDNNLVDAVKKSIVNSNYNSSQSKSVISSFFIDNDDENDDGNKDCDLYDKKEALTKSPIKNKNKTNNNGSYYLNHNNTMLSPYYIDDDSENDEIDEINLISPISNQINTCIHEDSLSNFLDSLSGLLPTEEEKNALLKDSSLLSSLSTSSLNLHRNMNSSFPSQSTTQVLSSASKSIKKAKKIASSSSSATSSMSSPPCNYDPSTISMKTSLFQSNYGGIIPIGEWWKEEHDWKQYSAPPSWFHMKNINDTNNNRVIDHFNLILLVDTIEDHVWKELQMQKKDYITHFRTLGITFEVEKRGLRLGDFMWILRYKNKNSSDYEIVVNSIVERKTYGDLLQSITNTNGPGNRNRYIDQKRRILASGIENRFYIIEGDIRRAISEGDRRLPYASDSQAEANRARLNTALSETQLSGFHIVKTADCTKTASQLLAFSKRFICSVKLGYRDYDEWMTDKTSKKVPYDVMYKIFDPATMMNRKKLRYISSTLIYMIKGIGVKSGKLLLDHFGTFSNFYYSLINESPATRIEILRNLGIEVVCSEKIRDVLLKIY